MVGMGVKGTSSVNLGRNHQGFMSLLSSMASEWLLIFLLFVDAALSYLVTKFARYCELQMPCMLCSRLDHFFGNEKPDFYRSLLCSDHRTEISSLMSCHIHGNVADARGMCEECLMSVAMYNKLNPESYRLLVGKLGVSLDQCGFQSPFLNKNIVSGSLSAQTCSCCNKTWRARSNAQRLLHLTPIGLRTIKPNIKPPLPRLQGHGHLNCYDGFKKIRDKISGPATPHRPANTGVDALSHVGYSELKITSDSESEFPFSDDDDDRSSVFIETTNPKEVSVVPVKQSQQASDIEPSLLDQRVHLDVSGPCDVKYLASDVIEHGLGELNWEQANLLPNPSALPELISLDDVPPSSNVIEVLGGVSTNKFDVPLPHDSSILSLAKLVLQNDAPPSSNVMEIPDGVPPEKHIFGTRDAGHKPLIKQAEVSELITTTTAAGFRPNQLLNETATSVSNDVDPNDECKLADINKGRELSGTLAELFVSSDSANVHDQISIHGIGPSSNDTSPKVSGQDKLHESDCSSSNGISVPHKSASLEGNDSGYESLDGISVGEIEGESIVDRLKRQVDHDRVCMSSLYKELEEERNAAEVAANQAMAMITRLQEEKASLHMEALQYLRMMEEQAEYDMEALEKANDLLAEKEKEVQDLEAELENYRTNFPNEAMVESLPMESRNPNVDNMRIENNGTPCIKSNANVHCESKSMKTSEGSDKDDNIKTSLLDLESEKLYISQCLKKLERMLYQTSGNGAPTDMPRGEYLEKVAEGVRNPTKSVANEDIETDHQKEENGMLMPKDLSALNGSLSNVEGSDVSVEDNSSIIKGNNHFDSDWRELSFHTGEIDFNVLENEISDLNGRLVALETDRDFLEHAINSLRNGNEGLQFIKEIARQLQELRKIGIERRCQSVA